ncbi:hypothetical protein DM02DRAFT_330883 [Periconia macrospinosa]|uniref:Uncharacterized protein n=1 Tax=Periconia macrospinosa TaxID=97972 RepID=A0A2V1D383_9PLEO|nr:hypothetical protein DM02DRAFT_330883 [Periconia macrospinosa]
MHACKQETSNITKGYMIHYFLYITKFPHFVTPLVNSLVKQTFVDSYLLCTYQKKTPCSFTIPGIIKSIHATVPTHHHRPR